MKKLIAIALFLAATASGSLSGQALAANNPIANPNVINLNSQAWLGNFKLDQKQLTSVKAAVERALDAPIDVEQQCGEETGLCVVRSAREWIYEGVKYRKIVIHLHTIGDAAGAARQIDGKWTEITIK